MQFACFCLTILGVFYGLVCGRLILNEAHGSAMRDWNLHLCTGGALKRLGQQLLLGMLCMCLCVSLALAQSESGSVTGQVRDPQGAAVVGAEVTATNFETGITTGVTSSDTGVFHFPSLRPNRYKISVKANGFKESVLDIEVHVQDRLSENVTLALGSSAETVNVSASAGEVNTSVAVATEVERSFIENMPLNGRSFQALIALTPGNVTAKAYYSGIGQFSVNGQRTDANYFSIDGVSANVGITQGNNVYLGAAGAGAAQASSNNGGYNNMVSVDALQEYKIQTSTFEPEYGRTPGAQLSIVTRSGSNQWHGVLFEYLRNEAFDSKDYFARVNKLPRPAEKQNDFGGTLGGPLLHNKLFFFFSYEGLRLRVPFTRTELVPSTSLRASAIPAVAPLLNAYPLPNKNDVAGVPVATAISTFSNPSVLNATSLKLDYAATTKLSLFIRGNYGPSNGSQHGAFDFYSRSTLSHTISNVDTITAGATYLISDRLVNDLRVNLSHAKGATVVDPTNFGGATVPSEAYLFQSNPTYSTKTSVFGLYMLDGTSGYYVGNDATNHQRQFNLVDSLSWSRGHHNLKFGLDYRRLSPTNGYRPWDIFYLANSFADLANGTLFDAGITSNDTSELRPIFTNVSLYAQDEWRVAPRFTLSYGVRWDYDPPPSENSGHPFYTATNLNDPANVALAPKGTPLWSANKRNFAPRLGIAYTANNTPGRELVIRGGGGIYYGLGNQQGAQGTLGFPYGRSNTLYGTDCGCGGTSTYPISVADAAPIPFSLDPPYGGNRHRGPEN
jgi:outer membrane receptor protein involved in Fe transport